MTLTHLITPHHHHHHSPFNVHWHACQCTFSIHTIMARSPPSLIPHPIPIPPTTATTKNFHFSTYYLLLHYNRPWSFDFGPHTGGHRPPPHDDDALGMRLRRKVDIRLRS